MWKDEAFFIVDRSEKLAIIKFFAILKEWW